jgi:hypothetical protein
MQRGLANRKRTSSSFLSTPAFQVHPPSALAADIALFGWGENHFTAASSSMARLSAANAA